MKKCLFVWTLLIAASTLASAQEYAAADYSFYAYNFANSGEWFEICVSPYNVLATSDYGEYHQFQYEAVEISQSDMLVAFRFYGQSYTRMKPDHKNQYFIIRRDGIFFSSDDMENEFYLRPRDSESFSSTFDAFFESRGGRSQRRMEADAREERLWREAQSQNTLKAYRNYLDSSTEQKYYSQAQQKISEFERDEKDFKSASGSGSVKALQDYLRKYPNGIYRQQAEELTSELILWENTSTLDTSDAYSNYLAKSKMHKFKETARRRIEEEEEWDRIASSKRSADYNNYKTRYPGSPHVAQADYEYNSIRAMEAYHNGEWRKCVDFFQAAANIQELQGERLRCFSVAKEEKQFLDMVNSTNLSWKKDYLNTLDAESKFRNPMSNHIAIFLASRLTAESTGKARKEPLSYAMDKETKQQVRQILKQKKQQVRQILKQKKAEAKKKKVKKPGLLKRLWNNMVSDDYTLGERYVAPSSPRTSTFRYGVGTSGGGRTTTRSSSRPSVSRYGTGRR